MASDLDRHCASLERNLSERIARIDAILSRFCQNPRLSTLRDYRDSLVIELHDMTHAHSTYDACRNAAYDDPTGQDADSFDAGESSHGWQSCGGGYRTNGSGDYREDFGS